jgi:hypothetical protein
MNKMGIEKNFMLEPHTIKQTMSCYSIFSAKDLLINF